MARPTKYDIKKLEEYKEVIENNCGLVAPIAKALGINRNTLYNWRKANEEFDEAFIDATENVLDFTESALFREAKLGMPWAVCFLLKCKGKARGYVEKEYVPVSTMTKEDLLDTMKQMQGSTVVEPVVKH